MAPLGVFQQKEVGLLPAGQADLFHIGLVQQGQHVPVGGAGDAVHGGPGRREVVVELAAHAGPDGPLPAAHDGQRRHVALRMQPDAPLSHGFEGRGIGTGPEGQQFLTPGGHHGSGVPDGPAVRQVGEAHAVTGDLPFSGLTGRCGHVGHAHHGSLRRRSRHVILAGKQHAFPGAFGAGLEEQDRTVSTGQPGQIAGTGDSRKGLGLKTGPKPGSQRTEHVERGGCGLPAAGGTEDETGGLVPELGQAGSFFEEQAAGLAAVGALAPGKGPKFESRRRSARFGSLHRKDTGNTATGG